MHVHVYNCIRTCCLRPSPPRLQSERVRSQLVLPRPLAALSDGLGDMGSDRSRNGSKQYDLWSHVKQWIAERSIPINRSDIMLSFL